MRVSLEVKSLLANPVFLDLVLERPQAYTEQFGCFLAMIGDFRKSPPDDFFFDFFHRTSECDDHGSNIFFAGLNLFRHVLGLDHILAYGHDQTFEEVAELPNIPRPSIQS